MDLCEEIAKVAYEIFEREGRVHGRHLEHWCEAEIIVTKKYELNNQKLQGDAATTKAKKSPTKSATEKKAKAEPKKSEKTAAKPRAKKTTK